MGAKLAEALAAFQAELPQIKKTQTAKVKTKTGSDYSYTYAGLPDVSSTVLPLLGKHGLSFTASPTLSSERFVLAYQLLHSSGESLSGEYPLPSNGSAQELGSAITYARRYALCSVVGVAAEDDDDGQAAARTDVRRRRSEPDDDWEAAAVPTAEQTKTYDRVMADISAATDAATVMARGSEIRLLLTGKKLTPNQYRHVAQRASERLAEFNQEAPA